MLFNYPSVQLQNLIDCLWIIATLKQHIPCHLHNRRYQVLECIYPKLSVIEKVPEVFDAAHLQAEV